MSLIIFCLLTELYLLLQTRLPYLYLIIHNISSRLTTIDESASILSDISYDKTDDSLVCHFSLILKI